MSESLTDLTNRIADVVDVQFTPSELLVFDMLHHHSPRWLSIEALENTMGPPNSGTKTIISQLRRKLGAGWRIENRPRVGYRLMQTIYMTDLFS